MTDPTELPSDTSHGKALIAGVIVLCVLSFVAGGLVQRYGAPGTPAEVKTATVETGK